MADGTSTGYRKLEKKRSLNMFLRYKLQTVITSWFYHLVGDHIVPLFWVPVLLFCICHPQWCNHIWPIACFGCQHRGCLQGVFFVFTIPKKDLGYYMVIWLMMMVNIWVMMMVNIWVMMVKFIIWLMVEPYPSGK